MNYYQVLGIKSTATDAEIKSAYKELAKRYHPDNKETGNNSKMQELNSAYDTLKDVKKREMYDLSQSGHSPYTGSGANTHFYTNRYSNIPPDILSELFPNGAFNDIFGFSGQRHAKPKETKNRDLYITLSISIADAFNGCEKLAQIKEGTQVKTLSIVIPKTIRNGMKLKLAGQAPRQNLNIPAGDLIVQVMINSQPDVTIVGDNLISIIQVSPIDAITGTTVIYKNLDGEEISVDIPPGIRHSEYITIPFKGFHIAKSDERGNLMLQLHTTELKDLPEKIKKKLMKINEELKNSNK